MTSGGIVVAGCVIEERTGTIGGVVEANRILKKCGRTGGRIVAVLVAQERSSAIGSVVVASCVFRERVRTGGSIAAPVVLALSAPEPSAVVLKPVWLVHSA